MSQADLNGTMRAGPREGAPRELPVLSTGCLLVASAVVFVVVIVFPALIWTLGIVFGQ